MFFFGKRGSAVVAAPQTLAECEAILTSELAALQETVDATGVEIAIQRQRLTDLVEECRPLTADLQQQTAKLQRAVDELERADMAGLTGLTGLTESSDPAPRDSSPAPVAPASDAITDATPGPVATAEGSAELDAELARARSGQTTGTRS